MFFSWICGEDEPLRHGSKFFFIKKLMDTWYGFVHPCYDSVFISGVGFMNQQ